MSHFFNQVGKVFSAVWDFIRPVVEVVAIAAAVYFTAGLALSYFPATAGFAAAMPGFASTTGVAGEGVFSSLASSIGMGGGIQAGAAADASLAADAGFATAATNASAGITAATASPAADTAVGASVAPGGVAVAPASVGGGIGTAAAAPAAVDTAASVAGSSASAAAVSGALTNKLLLASVGTQLISGLTAPSPTDIAAAKAGFYGSFYGKDASGAGAPTPNLSVGPQAELISPLASGAQPIPGVNVPSVQNAAPAPGLAGFQGVQQAQLIPAVPSGAMPAPGAAQGNQLTAAVPLAKPQLIPSGAPKPAPAAV